MFSVKEFAKSSHAGKPDTHTDIRRPQAHPFMFYTYQRPTSSPNQFHPDEIAPLISTS